MTLVTHEPPERLNLRDGRPVDVRPLERHDRRLLATAIRRLSDRSRYLRFATPKPLTERELDYLVDVDHHDHEALLAIDPLTAGGSPSRATSKYPMSRVWSSWPLRSRTTGRESD